MTSDEQAGAAYEGAARQRLLASGAKDLAPRPWEPAGVPPSSVDLVRYAVWRSTELDQGELWSALALMPAARAEVEGIEVGLLFAARSAGMTWAQIASAMGFNSAQACQQHSDRLLARQGK